MSFRRFIGWQPRLKKICLGNFERLDMQRKFFALFVFCMIFISSITASAQATATSPFPAPTGPFKVGTVIRQWGDNTRDETFTEATDDKRQLLVQFWYPADVKESDTLAPYMAASDVTLTTFEALIEGSRDVKLPLSHSDFAAYQSHSYSGAVVAAKQPSYPVLVFSPGFGATLSMYTVELEEIASQGYIVVGINHPYGSAATAFLNGPTVTINPNFNASGNFPVWVQDQIFVLSQLETLNSNDPDKVFTGKLDLKHIGVFGHSLGAGVAMKVATQDKHVSAILSEDSPALGKRIDKTVEVPFLMMESEQNVDANVAVYQQAKGPAYDLAMNTFEHDNFGDLAFWPGIEPLKSASALGSVDSARANKIVNAYVLAFFDKYLKGKAAPLLDGPSADYKEVQFQSK
jgi:pimeloyl-ACP methyl ester carboxylesterase